MNRSEALIRALWLTDNTLRDRHIDKDDWRTGILTRMRALHFSDERAARDALEQLLHNPLNLLENCDALNELLFEFHQGLPRLKIHDDKSLGLIRLVDPDSLVCLHKNLALPIHEDYGWASIAIRDGHFSNDILRNGSVDTHIHLGGTLPPLFYWLTLMSGEILINVVNAYVKNLRGYANTDVWQTAITQAMWIRLRLAYAVQKHLGPQAFPYLPDCGHPVWQAFTSESQAPKAFAQVRDFIAKLSAKRRRELAPKDRLWPFWDPLHPNGHKTASQRSHYALGERRLLTQVAQLLRSPRHYAIQSETENLLLSYLRTKNAFHQLLIHDYGTDGLMRFIENFSRRGFYFGFTRHRKRQRRIYLHLEESRMRAALDMQLHHAFSCEMALTAHYQPIRRLEMRVSILENTQFLRLIHAWLTAIAQHIHPAAPFPDHSTKTLPNGFYNHLTESARAFQASQIGLVFHLNKKSANLLKGESEQKLAERAKHSARKLGCVLRDFPYLRHFIVGLDVAGDERNSPPRRFCRAYHHLQQLQQNYRASSYHPPIQLGWTYHVGEDYGDLLTSLRHLDEVDSLLLGRDGGRLGHALALGEPPARFYQRRNGQSELAVGTHVLDMVWAWGRLIEARVTDDIQWLEARITKFLDTPQATNRKRNIKDSFDRCYRAMGLQERNSKGASPFSLDPDDHQRFSEQYLLKKLQLSHNPLAIISIDGDQAWVAFCARLQMLLRQHLAMRPVCIEANPTSNLVIGNYTHYHELPYPILVNERLALSLNTDDPGLFMTSLPGEYSVMYRALADTGTMSHREILSWLSDRLLDGQHSSFLNHHVPVGKDNPVIYAYRLRKLFKFGG